MPIKSRALACASSFFDRIRDEALAIEAARRIPASLATDLAAAGHGVRVDGVKFVGELLEDAGGGSDDFKGVARLNIFRFELFAKYFLDGRNIFGIETLACFFARNA